MCNECQQFVAALRASDSECQALREQLRAVSQVLYGLADVIERDAQAQLDSVVEVPYELEEISA